MKSGLGLWKYYGISKNDREIVGQDTLQTHFASRQMPADGVYNVAYQSDEQ